MTGKEKARFKKYLRAKRLLRRAEAGRDRVRERVQKLTEQYGELELEIKQGPPAHSGVFSERQGALTGFDPDLRTHRTTDGDPGLSYGRTVDFGYGGDRGQD